MSDLYSPDIDGTCPVFAPFFGLAGITFAMSLSAAGASYGTAKAGAGIGGVAPFNPALIMKCLIPVIMAGILAIYGLVIAVITANSIRVDSGYSLFSGFLHLGSGLSVGFGALSSGYCIGLVGDAGVRGILQEPRLFVMTILVLIFAEVLGLYGLIVALIINTKAANVC